LFVNFDERINASLSVRLRQVFNDTDSELLWLIVAAPEEAEFLPGAKTKPDRSLIYPVDPKQLPKELSRVE